MTFNNFAISERSLLLRYFFISNCFSSSKICLPVNVVRAFFFFDLASASSVAASTGRTVAVAVTVVAVAAAVRTDDVFVSIDSRGLFLVFLVDSLRASAENRYQLHFISVSILFAQNNQRRKI